MGSCVAKVDKEVGVKSQPALRIYFGLHHPPRQFFGIELVIPGAVERIGGIDAPAIAADLDLLRAAEQRSRMLGMAGVRNIILVQFARSPAGDIEVTIIR